jgi:hypothetical protein
MAWVMLHGFKKGVAGGGKNDREMGKDQIIAPKASNVESYIIITGDEQKTSYQSVSLKSNLI